MDLYYSVHGRDVSSFDLPSTHRLPTVSAAQAHADLSCDPSRFVSTGLDALDAQLSATPGNDNDDNGGDHASAATAAAGPVGGGVQRGIVTEIWGPPGVGKTSLGLHLASNVLREGRAVVWVDAFSRVCPPRLNVAAGADEAGDGGTRLDEDFVHYTCPTLPHLIALLCRPSVGCIPHNTSLVVVDSLSTLVNHAFPRIADSKPITLKNGTKVPSQAAKRQQTLQYVAGALQKLAATRNLAVVVLSQCATRMQASSSERGAAASLIPAVNASAWEEGVSTRVVLFRDWSMQDGTATAARFAAALKINGKRVEDEDVRLAAFDIGTAGLIPVSLDHGCVPDMASLTFASRPKRRRGDGNLEVPDSDDDEDYGWQDEDATALPPMPPQWQGSEDVLLGRDSDDSEEEGEGGDGSSSSSSDGQGEPVAKETEEAETEEAAANADSHTHR
ncbi:hypothetical protein, variant [Magnaporthiopsis poae ATCC 64411]|uniref:RecA family profile 1 domain-containing protein n=1 Tax=Magnaporthiopsis poae (strain ATCC 64411 / 73-15) TaxID=644358 RepID=A0A0C4DYQ5_MAGP6|nr:hypothetical protein, variant [Magnaporthiopsis poae ATCC 64411]